MFTPIRVEDREESVLLSKHLISPIVTIRYLNSVANIEVLVANTKFNVYTY